MLPNGLYEQVINRAIEEELSKGDKISRTEKIDAAESSKVLLLFVREYKTDRITGGAGIYTFLGTANYVNHSGDRPMSITWKLDKPIPAKFLKKTNKLMIG